MATRALGLGGQSHQIGNFAGLQIAEAGVVGTALADRTLQESQLRSLVGVGIIGVWDRGDFAVATGDTKLCDSSILLLAGTADQLARFDEEFAVHSPTDSKAIIIGGGRVGAAAQSFMSEDIDVTIIDRLAERRRSKPSYVIGDAADRSVLEAAGIEDAGAILITTHDDNVNVYLTRYCRGLRPDARIVSRSNLGRNVTTLYAPAQMRCCHMRGQAPQRSGITSVVMKPCSLPRGSTCSALQFRESSSVRLSLIRTFTVERTAMWSLSSTTARFAATLTLISRCRSSGNYS